MLSTGLCYNIGIMTSLVIEKITLPAAELGPENPLPYFRHVDPDSKFTIDESVPVEDRQYMGWRTSFRVLPHRMQDSYGRKLSDRQYLAVILENEHLRAEFIPEIGGRLTSLIHKKTGVELLEPVKHFQPANVALRNAWIAGGVEWNTAQLGHHYLTCAPMFAAKVTGVHNEPVLRMYAWERTKRFPYQLDFHLPPGSEFLYIRVRIINSHDEEMPMYWWSNIAVPQSHDRRVLASAQRAVTNAPGGFAMVELPNVEDVDVSYPTNIPYSREYFFRIDDGQRPWAASLDKDGRGLIHTSTPRLRGRKMFVWGVNRGGQRWQEYLLGRDRAYVEIQGGLARTQLESIPMPGKAQWDWTEAYGLMQLSPSQAHCKSWTDAVDAVDVELEKMLPNGEVTALDREFAAVTTRPPEEIIFAGEGWGSLEAARNPSSVIEELPFAKQYLTIDQMPWLTLLDEGYLPEREPEEGPGHFMVQPEWRAQLEESIECGKSDHWLGWLHLGVMRLENLDPDGARAAWIRSIEHKPTSWAYRNLSVLASRENDIDAACDYLKRAWDTGPQEISLALEYANILERHERWDDLRTLLSGLPDQMSRHERMLIVAAKLALHFNELSEVEQILTNDFASIREGEVTLTDLWFTLQAKRISVSENIPFTDELMARVRRELIPPQRLDQRMAGEVT